jgi:hypothetical protein
MSLLQKVRLLPFSTVNDQQAQQYANSLRDKLIRADFLAAESDLLRATDQNRERLIYGIAAEKMGLELAVRWTKARERSAFAQTLLGACLIVTGWNIRGAAYAEDVEDAAWKPFLAKLESAQSPLYKAIELDASIAEPFAWLIQGGLGLELEAGDFHRLFTSAIARQPMHWGAHYKYFFALTEKWGGSHDEMFEFVRSTAAKSARGSSLHSLVAFAYMELALAITTDRGAKQTYTRLRQPEHAREVVAALYAYLDANPDNLAYKLSMVSGGMKFTILNQFAASLYLCGATDEARQVLMELDREIERTPWCWISKGIRERIFPNFVYDRACRDTGVVFD